MDKAGRGFRGRPAYDGLAFGLYLALMLVTSVGLAAADWADHLALIPVLVILATVTGAALARSRFSAGVCRLFSTAYALFFMGWFFGQTLDPALLWAEKLSAILGRLGALLSSFMERRPNPDTLMFVLLMAAVYWWMASYGAMALLRGGHLWRAVLPPGLALLVNAYYAYGLGHLDLYVGLYVLIAVVLLGRMSLDDRRTSWRSRRIRIPPGLGWALVRVGAVASIVMVAGAWAAPVFAQSKTAADLWSHISGPWVAARDRLGNVVADLRSPVLYIGDAYGTNLQLAAGSDLNNDIVMVVATDGVPSNGGRLYWQARTYSDYQSGNWTAPGMLTQDFDPRQDQVALPPWNARQTIEVAFQPRFPILSRLYVPGDTFWVDRTSQFSYLSTGGTGADVTAFVARQPIYNGENYSARASVPIPSADQLRQAGVDYPDWVQSDYLQVPESLSLRFVQLARSIGDGVATPYDQAQAVTHWLRDNIEYSRVTQAPPINREPLDWFVFDYKIGFCNFYASTEVMMLRVLGIPSRLAVGYASGTYNEAEGVYEVRGVDAHAWPEAYFPGFGWVPFEPTVSQPEIRRPEQNASLAALPTQAGPNGNGGSTGDLISRLDRLEEGQPVGAGSPGPAGSVAGWWVRPALILLILVLLLGVILINLDPAWNLAVKRTIRMGLERVGVALNDEDKLHHFDDHSPTARYYHAWVSWLPRLGLLLQPADTPFERARLVADQVPGAGPSSQRLIEAYVAERFGRQNVDIQRPAEDWRSLHRLFRSRYFSGLRRRILVLVQDPLKAERAGRLPSGPEGPES
jgi:transglutaminase-like putative cysteine protease